jgi:hypothetical protein
MLELQKKVCLHLEKELKRIGVNRFTVMLVKKENSPFPINSSYVSRMLSANDKGEVFEMNIRSWEACFDHYGIEYININGSFVQKPKQRYLRKLVNNSYINPIELQENADKLKVSQTRLKAYIYNLGLETFKKQIDEKRD